MADKPAPKIGLTANTSEIIVLCILLIVIVGLIGGFLSAMSTNSAIADFFKTGFHYIKVTATVISMIAIAIAIYSFMRISEIAAEETRKLGLALNWNSEKRQKNERWDRVEKYMSSLSSSDWKIAILEADNILDQVVERMGYPGETLGERMKNIEASDFPYLDEAWTAHKTRNSIAHKGTDYELTRSEAEQTINIYHRVFKELGYL